jgi:hypothetical protein
VEPKTQRFGSMCLPSKIPVLVLDGRQRSNGISIWYRNVEGEKGDVDEGRQGEMPNKILGQGNQPVGC